MRNVGVFYETKRGETVPTGYRSSFLHTDLVGVGKLCLASIFQLPGTCRNKPSSLYQEKYYDPIFNGNQAQIASVCKELLYIDSYFRTTFQRKFDHDNDTHPNSSTRISFAHNARTICVAFVAFAARYKQGNLTMSNLAPIFSNNSFDSIKDSMYDIYRNLGDIKYLFPPTVWNNKDQYDAVLNKLFSIIIEAGIMSYSIECRHDPTLTATNYLKKDENYYEILVTQWQRIISDTDSVFAEIDEHAMH